MLKSDKEAALQALAEAHAQELREARRAHEAASEKAQQQKVAEVEARLREDEKNRAAEASERFAA